MDHSAVWMMLVFYAGTCSLPLVAGDCTGIDQCSCQYDDGSGAVYLNSLGKSDLTPMFSQVAGGDGSKYSYNPCYPFTEGSGSCQQAAACELNSIGQEDAIATQETATFKTDGGSLQVAYSYGSGILTTTTVDLVCDQHACTPEFSAQGATGPNSFGLTLKTVCACAGRCDQNGPIDCKVKPESSGGIGGGTIFLIVLLVVIAVYLIGGMAFQKFVRKAQGKEIIPNYEFWSNVPGYLRSAVMCMLKPCMKKQQYNSI